MIKINVVVGFPKWKKKIKNIKNYFKLKQRKFNNYYNSQKKIKEFTVFLTNNSKMKNLNKKYRKINKPTDVLSFPLNIKIKSKIYLGDIAISYEIVNKRSYNSSFVYELDKMWIHGYLHLSGYDHIKNLDFEKMYKKENLIFKQLNS
jgi:probable rRNA maturation factor